MDSQQTDQAFDKAVAKGLRRRAETEVDCPGPDIMAAFWDRSLSSDERARWEAHFAGCERCQAQMAALARTAETEAPAADPTSHLGWLFDWHWFAAVSTAALIVIALWVADPGRLTGGETPTVVDSEIVRLAEDVPADRAQAEAPAAPAAAEPRSETESLETRARVAQRDNAAEADAVAADEIARLDRDQQRVAGAEEAQRSAVPEPTATAARRPVEPGGVGDVVGGVAGAAFRELAQTDPALVVSVPDSSVRWRITPSGAVERSTDGGASWVVQVANPGVQLTSGTAPSDSVCWLVGQAGAVFRTTNGETWERLPAPTSVDLMGVEAEDSLTAIVTTADGARYLTTDGGQTWASQ